jgi:serine/threonine protein phosphatase PrpC
MQTLAFESYDAPTLPLSLEDTLEAESPSPRPAALVEAAGVTHPGRVRARNEDAYTVLPNLGFCAVADGLGGRPAGDVASGLAIREARRFLSDASLGGAAVLGLGAPTGLGDLLVSAVHAANTAIHAASLSNPRLAGMGTTFVGLLVAGGRAAIVHVGDSRAYRIRAGRAERLTTDHSMRELYLKVYGDRARPEIAERNAAILTRVLGVEPSLHPDVLTCAVEPGDVFLLCSDGLWGLLDDEELAFALAGAPTLETALAKLLATAYNRGAHDNVTAVLLRCAQ